MTAVRTFHTICYCLLFLPGRSLCFWQKEPQNTLWKPVDPDYNWNKRRTGTTPEWRGGFALWKHYNASSLEDARPTPWTQGNMFKFLRRLNETSFELKSLYEPSAIGLWSVVTKEREMDGLLENGFTFSKTPNRVSKLPFSGQSSRVTIVHADGATVSGPRTLPRKPDDFSFAEIWLAETVDGVPESSKVGIFCQYNSTSGDLIQAFCMSETACADDAALSPDRALDLDSFRRAPTDPSRTAKPPSGWMSSVPLAALLQDYRIVRARSVRTTSPHDGEEMEMDLSNFDDDLPLVEPDLKQECYWCHRFENGIFLRLPRNIHGLEGDDTILIELGCWQCNGNYHRVILYGTKDEGLHTTIYEDWKPREKDANISTG
mmetsp:Transcript_49018/g.59133  ORF Transcript_49018/g.59133 Transcript_49018/m.59133 type:complete len:375 (-) Transcript_49018:216-1340(-)